MLLDAIDVLLAWQKTLKAKCKFAYFAKGETKGFRRFHPTKPIMVGI
jgi:hypothetical protein